MRARLARTFASVRVRVVVGYVGLLLAALLIGLLVTRQLLFTRLDRQIEQELAQEIEEVRQLAAGNDPETGEPFNEDAAAILETFLSRSVPLDGEAFFTLVAGQPFRFTIDPPSQLLDDRELVATWAELEAPLRLDVTTPDAGTARTLAVPLRTSEGSFGTFIVASFPQEAQDELNDALRIIALASGLVLVASAAVAWGLAGRVLRPVRRLTATAQQVSDSDLSARIPVEGQDELAELGNTFNAMLDRLEAGMAGQRQFLDDVAHELRTPLTIVRGHLEVSGGAGDHDETIALVTDELDRMGRYVDDLLLLAKAEERQFLHLGPVDLGELAETLVRRAVALGDRRWQLDEAPRAGLVAAVADGGRIEQAMLNLMTNAVQHTLDGDEIGLGVQAGAERVRLWVRDTGAGVPEDARTHIFDRAARGAASRVSRPDGSGIGLSIVVAIAHAHRGAVSVADTPGGGATFTIDIPLDPEADLT